MSRFHLMKKYESHQVNMSSSSLLQRIKDGIVSPLALKLGFLTAFQPVPSPVNHNSSILKLQKDLKAQEDRENEQIARLKQERKIIMHEISASHLKTKQIKQDINDMKMEMQELKQQLLFEQNQNFAARQEIKRNEQQKEEENLYDQEDVQNQEEEDLIHYSFLSMPKLRPHKILQGNNMDNMDEMRDIDNSHNLSSFEKRLNLNNRHKIFEMDSEEDSELKVQEVD